MPTVLQFIRSTIHEPSPRLAVMSLLQTCRQHLFTGLMQVGVDEDERLDVLMISGKIVLGYSLLDKELRRLDPIQTENLIMSQAEIAAIAVKLPMHGLHLYKLFSESARGGFTEQIPTSKIVLMFPDWQILAESSLVEFHWPSADGLLYVLGQGSHSQYSFFIAGESRSEDVFPAAEAWQEPTCTYVRHAPVIDSPAWAEYHLRLSFIKIGNALLARYEKLGGRALLNALNNDITELTQEGGADIRVLGSTLVDHQIVSDVAHSAKKYGFVLRTMLAHMQATVGDSMVATILRDLFQAADPFVFKYAREFNLIQSKWLDVVGGEQP